MAFLMVDQGEGIMFTALANSGLTLKLFKNSYTPVDATTEANLTEATFTGYSAISLPSAASWTITEDAPTSAVTAQQTFTSTADQAQQNIYGYYLVVTGTGKLVCTWKFDSGPYPIVTNGDKILVTPTIQLKKTGE